MSRKFTVKTKSVNISLKAVVYMMPCLCFVLLIMLKCSYCNSLNFTAVFFFANLGISNRCNIKMRL